MRFSRIFASLAATAILASSVVSSAGILILPPPIKFPLPVDILASGKTFDKSWDGLDFDAKRDTPFGTALAKFENQLLRFGVDLHLDANATAKIHTLAYAHPGDGFLIGSAMGVSTEASLAVNGAILVNDFSRSATFTAEASYVRPAARLCRKLDCTSPAPYYHEVVSLREGDGRVTPYVNHSQPDPLTSAPREDYYPWAPTTPGGSFGYDGHEITMTPHVLGEIGTRTSWTMSPSGGNVALDAYAHATVSLTLDGPSVDLLGKSFEGSISLDVIAGPDDGTAPGPMSRNSAHAHASATLDGSSLVGSGTSNICAYARGTFQASGIGRYSAHAKAFVVDVFNGSDDGYAAPALDEHPTLGCLTF